MNILVTGAAGFIGSHLSEALVKHKHQVIGIDNLNSYYNPELKRANMQDLKQQGILIHPLDLVGNNLDHLVKNIDFIFHLAAQPGISASTPFSDYERNNVQATYRLLEAALKALHLKGFINIATSSIYGEDATGDERSEPKPTSFYGVTKLAAEQMVMAYAREGKLPACSLRLFSVYGQENDPKNFIPNLFTLFYLINRFPCIRVARNI